MQSCVDVMIINVIWNTFLEHFICVDLDLLCCYCASNRMHLVKTEFHSNSISFLLITLYFYTHSIIVLICKSRRTTASTSHSKIMLHLFTDTLDLFLCTFFRLQRFFSHHFKTINLFNCIVRMPSAFESRSNVKCCE